mgnify:CR=1 FL=1
MEELLRKIEEIQNSITDEDLKKMSKEERRKYLIEIEKLQSRIQVLIDVMEGGK